MRVVNLYQEAINKKQLVRFALGKDEYFIRDREYDEHSVFNSWMNHILPLQEEDLDRCCTSVGLMFEEVFEDSKLDLHIKVETLLYHLYVFYYFKAEGRFIGDCLLLDLLEEKMTVLIRNYIEQGLSIESKQELNNSVSMIQSKGGLLTLSF